MAFEQNLIVPIDACDLIEKDNPSFQKISKPEVSKEQLF
jgi:hypothetical protein